MEGRVRRLRESPCGETAEVQTAQSQPSVGTPMEVPVPRKVRVACIFTDYLADYAGAGAWASGAGLTGLAGFGCGGAGEGLGDFEEGHAEFEEGGFEQAGLVGGEVSLGLLGEDG